MPVNRASSILAGLLASFGSAAIFAASLPSTLELLGAALVVGAIAVLSLPSVLRKR